MANRATNKTILQNVIRSIASSAIFSYILVTVLYPPLSVFHLSPMSTDPLFSLLLSLDWSIDMAGPKLEMLSIDCLVLWIYCIHQMLTVQTLDHGVYCHLSLGTIYNFILDWWALMASLLLGFRTTVLTDGTSSRTGTIRLGLVPVSMHCEK